MEIIYEADPGDSLIIEQEIKERQQFTDTSTYINPDTIEITITDPDGTTVVDSVSMSKDETGKYYYYWDTSQDDPEGDYHIEIVTVDGDRQGVVNDKYIRLS